MSRAMRVWVAIGGSVAALLAIGFPMAAVGTLWAVAALWRSRWTRIAGRLPGGWGFFVAAWLSGMIVEVLAIASNRHLPPDERVLFHPDPVPDLAIAAVFYAVLSGIWLALLRRRDFSTMAVFLITGLWGAAVEDFGQPLAFAIAQPLAGIPLLVIIALIYGTMAGIGAYVGRESLARVPRDRPRPRWPWYVLAMAALLAMRLL